MKTRLAASIGPERAAGIYRSLAERQLNNLPRGWRTEVWFAPAETEPEMRSWLGPAVNLVPQSDGDLGCRLTAAFAAAFARGASRVIAIGGDCPRLGRATLQAAMVALSSADVVLGPARDGGYYLLGLTRPQPLLFVDIPWSTNQVAATTLARTRALMLRTVLLGQKTDIDDHAAWQEHQRPREPMADVSVIVPAFNEAAAIRPVIETTRERLPGARICVVDGESGDGTPALARQAGAEVIAAPRGRGLQLAAGAACAQTEWLLFLHADTMLPVDAARVLQDFMRQPDAQIATFRIRFEPSGWFLGACAWFSRFDSVFTRFGDQGIFVRRDFYLATGGFAPQALFEDVGLLRRARRFASIRSLPAAVTTSSRRFEAHGHFRQQCLNAWLLARYLTGADPQKLARRYEERRLPARSGSPAGETVSA